MGSFHCIGHGGASALAPANTLASFDAAAELGVDIIEFDVRCFRGKLVLAHTVLHARSVSVSLDDALRHLALPRFAGREFNVDVKHVGCEAALLEALARHRLLGRTLVSSQVAGVLDRLRARDARVRRGISIGGRAARASRRWRNWRAAVLEGLEHDRWQALMAQHRLIDAPLRNEVAARGGRLYGWTVTAPATLNRLWRLGIDGAATTDPRLFAQVCGGAGVATVV